MATSLGILIGLGLQLPGLRIVLVGHLTWLVLFLLFGYVSLAS